MVQHGVLVQDEVSAESAILPENGPHRGAPRARPAVMAKKTPRSTRRFCDYLLLPELLKYLKNSEFESITITSPCALKLAR